MNYLDWLLHPAVQVGLLALLAIGMYANLLFMMRRQARALDSRGLKSRQEVDGALERLNGVVDSLRADVQELTSRAGLLVEPAPPRSGLNLNKRGLALRMHRRGDTPEEIARALELPKGEVELLLKVHSLIVRQF